MNWLSLITFFLSFVSFIPDSWNIITFYRNGTSIKNVLEEEEETKSWNEIVNRCDPRQGSTFSGNVSLLTSINHYEAVNGSTECPRRYQMCSGEGSIINLCSVALDGIPKCDCSDHCYKFSSCCIDSPLIQDSFNGTVNDVIELNTCHYPLTSPNMKWPIMIRTKCSPKWSSDKSWDGFNEIREGCERKNSSDFFRQVLVTSKDSHVTYQNIFCLVCNFDLKDPNDIIFWPSSILCDMMHPNLTEMATTSSAQVSSFIMNVTSNCTLRNHKPTQDEETYFKPCYDPNVMVSTCRKNWLRSSPDYRVATLIQRLCHLIHAPVIMVRNSIIPGSEEVVFFRNKFCAACQDVPLKDLFCLDHSLPSRNVRPVPESGQHPILSIRMKMNDEESAFEECNAREMMWDPFANVCRKVFCKVGLDFCSPSCSSNLLSFQVANFFSPYFKCNVYSIQVIFPLFSILLLYFSWCLFNIIIL